MRSAWNRAVMWLGHYQFAVYLVSAVLSVARAVVAAAGWNMFHVEDILREVTAVAAGSMVVVWLHAVPYHREHLCLRDVRETPVLDPQGEIDRRRGHLHRFHRMTDDRKRLGWMMLLVLVPTFVATTVQRLFHVGTEHLWNEFTVGLYLVQFPVFLYLMWTQHIHTRLQPWCPFCRRDGRGEHFEPVDPTRPVGQRETRLV